MVVSGLAFCVNIFAICGTFVNFYLARDHNRKWRQAALFSTEFN